MLKISEVAAILNITPRAVHNILARHEMAYHRIGKILMVDENDLKAYLQKNRVSALPLARRKKGRKNK